MNGLISSADFFVNIAAISIPFIGIIYGSQIIRILFIILPIYVSNACAMLLGGKTPIDFNKKFFDGRSILGQGKTFKGTIFGIIAGIIIGFIIWTQFPAEIIYTKLNNSTLILMLPLLAIFGDILGSFIKRRLGIERGRPVLLLDQLDFVIVPMAYLWLLKIVSFTEILIV